MLPKNNRVKRAQFEGLLQEGALFHTPFYSVRYSKNGSTEGFTFAVVVSKKVEKTAVKRNELKRRVRGAVEELVPSDKRNSPLSVVLFMKKEGAKLSFSELKKEIGYTILL